MAMTISRVDEEKNTFHTGFSSLSGSYPPGEPLLTVEEVADYLKLQPETIRSLARRGELPAIKLGKVWRFNRTAIQSLLTSKV
jgi:excisionase family DNA binding protein